jgi:anti-sigma B factor antagonist
MQTKIFDANLRTANESVIIDLSGEINAFADEAINKAYDQADSQGQRNIMLNFKNVTYINSTGIALIVGLMAKSRRNHKRLTVFGLTDHYVEIFQITRLADFMSIYPDEASASAAVV